MALLMMRVTTRAIVSSTRLKPLASDRTELFIFFMRSSTPVPLPSTPRAVMGWGTPGRRSCSSGRS